MGFENWQPDFWVCTLNFSWLLPPQQWKQCIVLHNLKYIIFTISESKWCSQRSIKRISKVRTTWGFGFAVHGRAPRSYWPNSLESYCIIFLLLRNKLLQTSWLKSTQIYYITLLEIIIPERVLWRYNQGVERADSFRRLQRRIHSSPLPASRGC